MPPTTEELTLKLANDTPWGKEGETVKLSLTPADVHDPTEMPNYLAGYRPFPFRADDASPEVLVDRDEEYYRTFNSDDAFRRVTVKGSIEGSHPEVDPKSALVKYNVVDRFVGCFVNEITRQNATAYEPRQAGLRRAKNAIMLDRELDVWGLLTTLASFDTANRVTLTAGQEWNGGASSNPIENLKDRIIASAQPVTDIWMNFQVAMDFLMHPLVKDYLKAFHGDGASSAIGARMEQGDAVKSFKLFALPPIHVVESKVKNETSLALDYVLGNDVVLTSQPPGVPIDGETICTTKTFRRRGNAQNGWDTREYRVENRGPKGGVMIVCSMADIAVITSNRCGGLIKSARQ